MTKFVADEVLDAALDKTATAVMMRLCSSSPTTRAEAISAELANHVMAGGDYTKANGDTSGRKVTVAAQSAVDVDTSGTISHVALDDGTILLDVTEASTPVAVTAGGTVDVGAFKQEIADPTP